MTNVRVDYVWVAWKDGDARKFSSPYPWSEEFRAVLVKDGFAIIRLAYPVPDTAVATVATAIGVVASGDQLEVPP